MKENVLTFSDLLYKKSENLYKNRITSALPSYYLAVYSDRTLLKNSSFYH
jgi:hypothetical protein